MKNKIPAIAKKKVGTTSKKTLPEDILDNLIEGCQIISPSWRYVYVNDAVAKQGKKTKDQLLGKPMPSVYPGIEKTEMFSHLKQCMKSRLPFSMENEFAFPNGSKGWFELRMEPVPQGVLIFSIDITERKNAELHLKDMDSLKNTFINIVAHQLRTPLNVMRWNIEEIMGGGAGKLTKTQEETLRLTHKANTEIISRLDDLLTALDLQENPLHLQKKQADIESLLKSVIAELQSAIGLKNIKLTVKYPKPSLPAVMIDMERVRGVFYKLIDNALTYTKEGGSINIILSRSGGKVRFEITDTGIGIPKAEKSGIFTRFTRGSNASAMQPDASGLGLYLTKEFVKGHKGHIGFTSKETQGSTFWFEIPYEQK